MGCAPGAKGGQRVAVGPCCRRVCAAHPGAARRPCGEAKALDRRRARLSPLEPDAAHPFFLLVSRRYEKGAMLIASDRSVAEWGSAFGDAVVATAILDRTRT
jgi:IstB-like ATP binding protein